MINRAKLKEEIFNQPVQRINRLPWMRDETLLAGAVTLAVYTEIWQRVSMGTGVLIDVRTWLPAGINK